MNWKALSSILCGILLNGALAVVGNSQDTDRAKSALNAAREAKKADLLKRLPEIRKAIDKAMAAEDWIGAGKVYSEVHWAIPDDPGLKQARAKIEPQLISIVQSRKDLRSKRDAALKALNAGGRGPKAILADSCGGIDMTICLARLYASGLCQAVCSEVGSGRCSNECKTCISNLVDTPIGPGSNCHPCLFADCYSGPGGGTVRSCGDQPPLGQPRIGNPRPALTRPAFTSIPYMQRLCCESSGPWGRWGHRLAVLYQRSLHAVPGPGRSGRSRKTRLPMRRYRSVGQKMWDPVTQVRGVRHEGRERDSLSGWPNPGSLSSSASN